MQFVQLVSYLFHDLVKVVAGGNGRGERVAIKDSDGSVAATSELKGNGAAPCSSAYDEDTATRL
jgi:hypothetical protein